MDNQTNKPSKRGRLSSTKNKSSRRSPQRKKVAAQNSKSAPSPHNPSSQDKVKIIPLGGMREIGKNMTVYEYGNDILVVDVGTTFPDDDMPGVELIIPDFSYLRTNASKIRGLVLTHGHEDHIGAGAWFMREFHCPVYGTPLTIKLIENKLTDNQRGGNKAVKSDPRLSVVKPGDKIRAGAFEVEFIHVNHSIADACALAIKSPPGLLIHSGDFKVDFTPVHGKPIDLHRFAELGKEGVLGMVLESTNVEVTGITPSEEMVGQSFNELFEEINGRIFVATFSSNVFRLQQIIQAAEAHKRKVVLLGYSMHKVFEAANSLGYIKYHSDTIIEPWDAERTPDNELVFITTGSQGEPMSALYRMAFSEHRQVNIKAGDTVLLSSSMIPGNERSIYRVINELYKRGAEVIYDKLADIHVSGHAYRDELRLLIHLCRPKYFVPSHGEFRHLFMNAQLAESQGVPKDQIFLLNNGDVLEMDSECGYVSGFIEETGEILIDGGGVGDVDQMVLRERRLLADDGVVTCFIVVDSRKNQMLGSPDIKAVGYIYQAERDRVIKACRQRVDNYVEKIRKQKKNLIQALQQNQFRDYLRNELFQQSKRRPVVIISIMEV